MNGNGQMSRESVKRLKRVVKVISAAWNCVAILLTLVIRVLTITMRYMRLIIIGRMNSIGF